MFPLVAAYLLRLRPRLTAAWSRDAENREFALELASDSVSPAIRPERQQWREYQQRRGLGGSCGAFDCETGREGCRICACCNAGHLGPGDNSAHPALPAFRA